jgi:hypothetical protein
MKHGKNNTAQQHPVFLHVRRFLLTLLSALLVFALAPATAFAGTTEGGGGGGVCAIS